MSDRQNARLDAFKEAARKLEDMAKDLKATMGDGPVTIYLTAALKIGADAIRRMK